MSKASSENYELILFQSTDNNTYWLYQSQSTWSTAEYTANESWDVSFLVDAHFNFSSQNYVKAIVYKNSTALTDVIDDVWTNYEKVSWTVYLNSWDKLKVFFQHNWSTRDAWVVTSCTLNILNSISKTADWYKPRELSNLWQYASITLLWIHTDWSRVNHE